MNILVGCEFSGIVRDAFIAKGHNAVSCDILATEVPGPHIQDDILNHIDANWDMLIAFPPCTHLCSSGARWFKYKQKEQKESLEFVKALMDSNINKICIENPVGVISTKIRKPDQIIQPWQFGDAASKATCLWLKNLNNLEPTKIVSRGAFFEYPNGKKFPQWMLKKAVRSITFKGIAAAMADQWS